MTVVITSLSSVVGQLREPEDCPCGDESGGRNSDTPVDTDSRGTTEGPISLVVHIWHLVKRVVGVSTFTVEGSYFV